MSNKSLKKGAALVLTMLMLGNIAKAADQLKWEPLNFEFSAELIEQRLQELANKKNRDLAAVEAKAPDFRKTYPAAVKGFAEIVFRTMTTPLNLPAKINTASPEDNLRDASYTIARYIAYTVNYVFGDSIKKTAPKLKRSPDDPDYDYNEDGEHDDQELNAWGEYRHFISNASFVQAVCPVIKPFGVWNLRWNYTSFDEKIQLRMVFDELDRVLGVLYGDGVKKKDLPEFGPAFGYQNSKDDEYHSDLLYFIERRYHDGGPKLMKAASECLSSIRKDLDDETIGTDPKSTTNIAEILNFKTLDIPTLGKKLDLQSTPLDLKTVYRLTHHYSAKQALPTPMLKEGESEYNNFPLGNILEDIDELTEFGVDSTRRLATHLTVMDPNYRYRSITREEFRELMKLKSIPGTFERFCVVEGSVEEENLTSYSLSTEGEEMDMEYYPCDPYAALYVREAK